MGILSAHTGAIGCIGLRVLYTYDIILEWLVDCKGHFIPLTAAVTKNYLVSP